MKISKLALLVIALSALSIAQAQASCDHSSASYNTFQWNRANYCAGNGETEKRSWYEWWYYKVIQPETHRAFFFTYGAVKPGDLESTLTGTHASIQFGNFETHSIVNRRFPIRDFEASYDKPWVRVADNIGSDDHLIGHLKDEQGGEICWDLRIEKEWGWNAMGWAMFVPEISNIYWFPAQASARMTGWIEDQGIRYDFDQAPAYQDRNWGRSFPKWWAWLVSDRFKGSPGTVLAAGGGRPKVLNGLEIADGMTIGLKHQGKVHEFRMTSGDTVKLNIHFGTWEATSINHRGEKIVISAFAPREKFMTLPFTTPQGGTFFDNEALTGYIHVQLYRRENAFSSHWERIADLETNEGGIEYGSFDESGLNLLYQDKTELY